MAHAWESEDCFTGGITDVVCGFLQDVTHIIIEISTNKIAGNFIREVAFFMLPVFILPY
jgi:hypothetical protein